MGISKLELFGSVLRDDFDAIRSDVDVLVTFQPGALPGWDFFQASAGTIDRLWPEGGSDATLGH